jgi:hypothetical protein
MAAREPGRELNSTGIGSPDASLLEIHGLRMPFIGRQSER